MRSTPTKPTAAQVSTTSSVQDDELTDVSNAARFARRFARSLAYVPARGQWMEFISHAWYTDSLGRITQHAIEVTRDMLLEASKLAIEAAQIKDKTHRALLASEAEALLAHARKSQQKPRLDAMLSIAATDPRLAVEQDRLDDNDLLLGVKNGVIGLGETTTFRSGKPDDFITRQTSCEWRGGDEDVACPLWEQFLQRVQPDPDVRHWLQMFVGYCLTGKTSEQLFVVMHGTGANGKSVMVEILKRLLGGYAQTVQFATFTERDPNAIRNDLASLNKARLVVANEGPEGARLDEGVVKQVTGEDAVTARFLHREFFTYTPRFKVVLVTNHKPVITGTDHGIWRRVVLVPFPVTIAREQQDKLLLDKLTAELPGILAWAVAGYHAWREQGLGDLPKALAMANAEYRRDSDVLGMWIEDHCSIDADSQSQLFTSSADLYKSYSKWALDMGHRPMSSKSLADRLRERGLSASKKSGQRGWRGIQLRVPTDQLTSSVSGRSGL
jgi:putative DNA primase/helicase